MPAGQGAQGAGTAVGEDTAGLKKKVLQLTKRVKDQRAELDRVRSGGGNAAGGDGNSAALQLRITQLEQTNRDLEEKLEAAELPEGAAILTGDDKKTWEAVKALALPGEKIVEAVKQRDEFKGKLDVHDRNAVISEGATLLGFKPTVLTDLATTKGFRVELRDEQVTTNGKTETKKVPYALVGPDDKTGKRLSEYVDANLKDYLPALKAEGAAGGSQGGGSGGGGTPYPDQSGSATGATGTGDAATKFLEARAKRAERITNPLMPPAPAKTA